jgi:hypothetical protein
MPTIQRFARCRLDMYSREHGVPHFHVIDNEDRRASYAIATQALIIGELRAKDTAEALAWAKVNQAVLEAKWKELNQ